MPFLGWAQILAYMAFCEVAKGAGSDIKAGKPGDFGWKVLTSKDPEQLNYKLQSELANCRLAMIAIVAMIVQNGVAGTTGPEMWAGSRGAFENELGVQPPVGFWDPVGFTAGGDKEAFIRYRSIELKHGRIAMLATMGYLTPELIGKFPGYLDPNTKLAFADIPNGTAAISKARFSYEVKVVNYASLTSIFTACAAARDRT